MGVPDGECPGRNRRPAREWGRAECMPKPPFAQGRRWRWRMSKRREVNHRVWYDPDTGYEYEPDPRSSHRGRPRTWHEIDPRTGEYRDLDPQSGEPVAGSEGRWRHLH